MGVNMVASWSLCNADGTPKDSIRKFLDDYHISFVHVGPTMSGQKLVYSDCMEPDFMCDDEQEVINRSSDIHHIFTRRKRILSECSNSSFLVFGTSWVCKEKTPIKRPAISFTTTSKMNSHGADGYNLRHEVTNGLSSLKRESKLPIEYWASSRLPLNLEKADHILAESKDSMYEPMFNIAIENQRCENFFTEKLVDCFMTKTVPIYFGTSDIGDFFDTRGMIIVEDMNELRDSVKQIDEDKYLSMTTYINENWERCQQYSADFCDRISQELDRLS